MGRAAFVAILLLIAGVRNIIYGIGYPHFFVGDTRDVLDGLHVGRIVGMAAAPIGAIGALLAVGGACPVWSLGIFALCVVWIDGLVIYGEDVDGPRSR